MYNMDWLAGWLVIAEPMCAIYKPPHIGLIYGRNRFMGVRCKDDGVAPNLNSKGLDPLGQGLVLSIGCPQLSKLKVTRKRDLLRNEESFKCI